MGNRCPYPEGSILYFNDSRAVLTNCTIADNFAGEGGTCLSLIDSDVTMTDSIVWGNDPQEIVKQGDSKPLIRYCAVRGWWPDLGNIHSDPLFTKRGTWVNPNNPSEALMPQDSRATWVGGDYHLKSQAGRWDPATRTWVLDAATSPCIDAGTPGKPVGHEPVPNGNIVNMGAYGGTNEASKSRPPAASP